MKYSFTPTRSLAAASLLALCATITSPAAAEPLQVTALAPGFTYASHELGVPFGGSIAVHPTQPNRLYVSYGFFGSHRILELDTDTGTTKSLTGILGNVGGITVLGNGDLVITENFASDTILRGRDLNSDGTFLQAGEVSPLIAPILHDGDFTGAQVITAPDGNAAAIPTGALVVQTADGGTSSELLVIDSPATAPAYRPPAAPFYSGFNYNGGVAFTPQGHVICGISEYPTGRVMALVNSNADFDIDPGESHEILGTAQLGNSIADLAVTGDATMLVSENSGSIRRFALPADLLTGSASPLANLAETNGSYLSTVKLSNSARPFAAGSAGPVATLYVSGYIGFSQATNLLAIMPVVPTAAAGWEVYE